MKAAEEEVEEAEAEAARAAHSSGYRPEYATP